MGPDSHDSWFGTPLPSLCFEWAQMRSVCTDCKSVLFSLTTYHRLLAWATWCMSHDIMKGVKRTEHLLSLIKCLDVFFNSNLEADIFFYTFQSGQTPICFLFDSFLLSGELSVSSMWDLYENQNLVSYKIYIII